MKIDKLWAGKYRERNTPTGELGLWSTFSCMYVWIFHPSFAILIYQNQRHHLGQRHLLHLTIAPKRTKRNKANAPPIQKSTSCPRDLLGINLNHAFTTNRLFVCAYYDSVHTCFFLELLRGYSYSWLQFGASLVNQSLDNNRSFHHPHSIVSNTILPQRLYYWRIGTTFHSHAYEFEETVGEEAGLPLFPAVKLKPG